MAPGYTQAGLNLTGSRAASRTVQSGIGLPETMTMDMPSATYETGDVYTSPGISSGPSFSASSAVSAATVVATTVLNTQAKIRDIEAKTEQIGIAMESAVNENIAMANVSNQQMRAVDRTVGDMMTVTGINRMKAEARLRAGAAETGTSGGTTKIATMEARMVEQLDNAVIIARGRAEKTSIMTRQDMANLSTSNRLRYMASGLASPTGAALSTLSAGIGGFTAGYNMLSASEREKFFSYNS